jgi:hypothetical protein
MRLSLRVVLVSLVALVAVGALISAPGAKHQSVKAHFTAGWCEVNGVSQTIEDATATTRCATDFSGTSWELFAAAGNTVTGTSQYPIGFVCKVNGRPAAQTCDHTPRYDEGTWAFFVAQPRETSWHYALTGASLHQTVCGSAEGWLWVPASSTPESSMPKTVPETRKCQ